MSWSRNLSIRFLLFTAVISGCHHPSILKQAVPLPHYPSASAIEYHQGKYYIMGDDAPQLLVLDSNFSVIDSVRLFSHDGYRIPKAVKADPESASLWKPDSLLLLGSGSAGPVRRKAFLMNLVSRKTDTLRLDTLYQRIQAMGIGEMNIEGACSPPGFLLLANRGNKTNPRNFLVLLPENALSRQSTVPITIIRIGFSDSSRFQGVSGLAYSARSDKLLLTVSTEDTPNNYDDGTIGKSYLWIVDNFSAKKNWKAVNPNRVIDLEKTDSRFAGNKIESVCITRETKGFLHLVLVADNDAQGSSTLFSIVVEKD